MIPVSKQPEPPSFDQTVRKRGLKFLRNNSAPYNWNNHSYWRDILPEIWRSYRAICAYCCHWIPLEQGSATVDHFMPKSVDANLAYEWGNFRLASTKLNAKKGDFTDVVDPFELKPNDFILLFPAMLIKPNPRLPDNQKKLFWATIKRLDLNDDEELVQARLRWVLDYCDGHISFVHLQRHAPFIAYEILRQGLDVDGGLASLFALRSVPPIKSE